MEEGERAKEGPGGPGQQRGAVVRVRTWWGGEGNHSKEMADLGDQDAQRTHFTGFFQKV